MTNYDYIEIVNAINATVGGMYNYTFPIVNNQNFKAMSAVLSDAPLSIQNAWIENLMNVACKTAIIRVYNVTNPYRYFYGDDIGLDGDDSQYVREVALDRFTAISYEKCGAPEDFFKCCPPKVRVQYLYNILRKKYCVTVTADLLISAFETYDQFGRFYDAITDRMLKDMEEDDKEEIQTMLDAAIEAGNIYLYPVARPVDGSTALAFSAQLQTLEADLEYYRSRTYNMNRLSQTTDMSRAAMLVAADVMSIQNTYNMAWAFNENYLKLIADGRLLKVGSKGFADNRVFGLLTDRDFLKINYVKTFPKLKYWENGSDLSEHRWLHSWKRLCLSYFSNAVAFVDPDAVGVDSVEIQLKSGKTTAKVGTFSEMGLAKVTPTAGKLADAVCTYTAAGFNSENSWIDPESGDIFVAADETASEVTITATSHLDDTKTGTLTVTIEK